MPKAKTMTAPNVLKLSCCVQNYAWGKIGLESKVAQLKCSAEKGFSICEDQPYAELWMGVHPKAPSIIASPLNLKGITLEAWLKSNRWALGESVDKSFNGQLPFLFKVLSINKALSIQAHPNKSKAEHLHSINPDKYPDPNHKPELVIALTPFKGLCGFRPFSEIKTFLTSVPELEALMSTSSMSYITNDNDSEEGIKRCFRDLMHVKSEVISVNLSMLVTHLNNGCYSDVISKDEAQLFLQLHSWFPSDVGCFCMFFLNIVHLLPGQSMFLGPNIPHAYISGDVIECMANSDNVVRAGLTPKYKDKDTLCEMLSYHSRPSNEQLFPSEPHPLFPQLITLYDPPVSDFSIDQIKVNQKASIPAITGPSILLIIEGSGYITIEGSDDNAISYNEGEVLFITSMNIIKIQPNAQTVIFRAFCE